MPQSKCKSVGFYEGRDIEIFLFFFNDYNNLSGGDGNASITVWVGNGLSGGRDQALVLRRLIEQDFYTEK